MPRFHSDDLRDLGVPVHEARLVADHMVESGLLGHDSHSVLRYPQYVQMVRSGKVQPGRPLRVLKQAPRMAQVSGGWNFGPVTATAAMDLAIEKARHGAISAVTVRDCNHVARLGRFAAMAPSAGNLVALLCANGHGADLAVAPHGGRERRLPTNPLAVAIPTGRGWPLVLDMTTSMTSGGALRHFRNRGAPVPEGCIVDADGNPTIDVEDYYGSPQGAMLPLGSPVTGHKGFGLAVVVEILAGALSGAGCSRPHPPETGNALFIAVLDIEAFCPLSDFLNEADHFIEWVKSSPPAEGFDEVLLPGENSHRIREERCRAGLVVDEVAWQQIREVAAELEVRLPAPMAA
ncbi:Ldh family oxidoreductase [Candidatus Latescibacterota bacterium]